MPRSHDPLFAPERKKHPTLTVILLLLIVLMIISLVLNHLNNSRVNLLRESVTVPTLPSSLENFRILQISDLHGLYFGQRQERLAAAIESARYDIVVVTGDITGANGDIGAFLALADLFAGKTPVYFIPGDEDPNPLIAVPHPGNSPLADYILAAQEHGAIYLDAPVPITRGKGTIWLSPEWAYTLDYEASFAAMDARKAELEGQAATPERDAALAAVTYELDQLERVRNARREISESDIHIAVTHHPLQLSALQSLQEWTHTENDSYVRTVSLILAGHYVAGQWRLPLIGALRAPLSAETGGDGWFPDDRKIVGLASFMSIPQYISPGLGVSAAIDLPPIRLFNTPAVTVLTLTTKLIH